ncbi:hypothetical protein OEZ85_012280 [Tetradesmus obliquus]|uniref:Mechanosensitive ion channel MscS domain-containing protein n=1 Tax=Tetradesmus obliquus TaxID=3088 RepID=A0ABY8TWU6_TETOB|nr:hypothetical protein OEZ85_012280 [Tetradesmus obliquus]
MLSTLVTDAATGPWETLAWKVTLDVLLPILGLLTLQRLIDLAAERSNHPHLPQAIGMLAGSVSARLVPLDAALQTLLQVAAAVFTSWFLVQLKNTILRHLLLPDAVRSGHTELERIYLPLSSLLTWAACLGCAIAVAGCLGLRLEPLLAVGGAGGIAAGFASQQVLTNMVSGVNIFLSRPFVVGDQVRFAGATELEGTVEAVEIMRTLLRTTGGTLLVDSGLAAFSEEQLEQQAAHAADTAADMTADVATAEELAARVSKVGGYDAAAAKPTAAPAGPDDHHQQQQQEPEAEAEQSPVDGVMKAVLAGITGDVDAGDEGTTDNEQQQRLPEAEPLPVSISLAQLAEDSLKLFVRCELMLPGSTAEEAVEQQTEAVLVAVSRLVKDKYQGTVLWC